MCYKQLIIRSPFRSQAEAALNNGLPPLSGFPSGRHANTTDTTRTRRDDGRQILLTDIASSCDSTMTNSIITVGFIVSLSRAGRYCTYHLLATTATRRTLMMAVRAVIVVTPKGIFRTPKMEIVRWCKKTNASLFAFQSSTVPPPYHCFRFLPGWFLSRQTDCSSFNTTRMSQVHEFSRWIINSLDTPLKRR